nr:hypothetical protein CFP56_10260 [Quercus suber]
MHRFEVLLNVASNAPPVSSKFAQLDAWLVRHIERATDEPKNVFFRAELAELCRIGLRVTKTRRLCYWRERPRGGVSCKLLAGILFLHDLGFFLALFDCYTSNDDFGQLAATLIRWDDPDIFAQ